MDKLSERRQADRLIALAILVYFASYMTRINFAAIISEFILREGVEKTAAAVITTVTAIVYGTGQLLSGYLGDRVDPRKLIFYGLLATTGMNILLPLCSPHIALMAVVWGCNGLAQAFMWPPLVRILSTALTTEDYLRSMPLLGFSTGGGTIAVYLLSPLIISVSSWKTVFFFCACVGLFTAFFFRARGKKLLAGISFSPVKKVRRTNEKKNGTQTVPFLLLAIILLSIGVQGLLRDGIVTWVPSFICDTFHLSSSVAILTSVVLPIFHILCNFVIYRFLSAMHNRVFTCVAILFAGMSVLLFALGIFGVQALWFAMPLLAMTIGLVHGTNSLQTCCYQKYFQDAGNISFLSGLLNFGSYIGSSVSTYLFAAISEASGWNATIYSWALFALLGIVLTVIAGIACKKRGYTYGADEK